MIQCIPNTTLSRPARPSRVHRITRAPHSGTWRSWTGDSSLSSRDGGRAGCTFER